MKKNSLLPGLALMLAEGSRETPALISACILELPELSEKYTKIARESAEKYQKVAKEYENCQDDQDYADWCKYFQDISADLLKEAGDTEHLVSMFQRISKIANELRRCSSSTADSSEENAEKEPIEEAEGAESPAEESAPANDAGTEESSNGAAEGAVCFGNSFNKIEECKKDPEKLNAIIEECKKLSDLFKKCAEVEGAWATYYSDWYKSSCDPNWRHNQLKNELMHDHHEAMSIYFSELAGKINPETSSAEAENPDSTTEPEGGEEAAETPAPEA